VRGVKNGSVAEKSGWCKIWGKSSEDLEKLFGLNWTKRLGVLRKGQGGLQKRLGETCRRG